MSGPYLCLWCSRYNVVFACRVHGCSFVSDTYRGQLVMNLAGPAGGISKIYAHKGIRRTRF